MYSPPVEEESTYEKHKKSEHSWEEQDFDKYDPFT